MIPYLEFFDLEKRTRGELKPSELAAELDTYFFNEAPIEANKGNNVVRYFPDESKYTREQICDAVDILRANPKYTGISIAYTQLIGRFTTAYVGFVWMLGGMTK